MGKHPFSRAALFLVVVVLTVGVLHAWHSGRTAGPQEPRTISAPRQAVLIDRATPRDSSVQRVSYDGVSAGLSAAQATMGNLLAVDANVSAIEINYTLTGAQNSSAIAYTAKEDAGVFSFTTPIYIPAQATKISISMTLVPGAVKPIAVSLQRPDGTSVATLNFTNTSNSDKQEFLPTSGVLKLVAKTGTIAGLPADGIAIKVATKTPFIRAYTDSALDVVVNQSLPPSNAIKVYGGFLRLDCGGLGLLNPNLTAIWKPDSGIPQEIPVETLSVTGDSRIVDIQAGPLVLNSGKLLIVAQESNVIAVAEGVLSITPEAATNFTRPDLTFKKDSTAIEANSTQFFKTRKFDLKVTPTAAVNGLWLEAKAKRESDGKEFSVGATKIDSATEITLGAQVPGDGKYTLSFSFQRGKTTERLNQSFSFTADVGTRGPQIADVKPKNFGTAAGLHKFSIVFDKNAPLPNWEYLKSKEAELSKLLILKPAGGDGQIDGDETAINNGGSQASSPTKIHVVVNEAAAALAVTVDSSEVKADLYQLVVNPHFPDTGNSTLQLADVHGNELEGTPGKSSTPYVTMLGQGETLPAPKAELAKNNDVGHGPVPEFPEFLKPAEPIQGFNPSDKVETRVVRLYYFRDAHRAAEICNRGVKSYNKAAVTKNETDAGEARTLFETALSERKQQELKAIQSAQKTRAAEQQLNEAQTKLQRAAQESSQHNETINVLTKRIADGKSTDVKGDQSIIDESKEAKKTAQAVLEGAQAEAKAAAETVQKLRETENQESNTLADKQFKEDRAAEERFRREVAAARTDPNTYVMGDTSSQDQVRRVSISVVGEGLIQLRGPIKGLNIVRRMLHELDSPVGQVRVGIHTIQINGEKEPRMEQVAQRIQAYIDHSRFLTAQSAEMLRKSVVRVASLRAVDAGIPVGQTQEERDQKYLYQFFGQDFIHELMQMDSEFLHSGNKILSLHSMDSTSLCSALFLMALANNTTREEILIEFQRACHEDLVAAEQSYYAAGLTCSCRGRRWCTHRNAFQLYSQNARFQSLRGFFDANIAGPDTMTPVQREFLRLAQIFKARLITELEYQERVRERALIEQRGGNPVEEEKQALQAESDAREMLLNSKRSLIEQKRAFISAAQAVNVLLADETLAKLHLQAKNAQEINKGNKKVFNDIYRGASDKGPFEFNGIKGKYTVNNNSEIVEISLDDAIVNDLLNQIKYLLNDTRKYRDGLEQHLGNSVAFKEKDTLLVSGDKLIGMASSDPTGKNVSLNLKFLENTEEAVHYFLDRIMYLTDRAPEFKQRMQDVAYELMRYDSDGDIDKVIVKWQSLLNYVAANKTINELVTSNDTLRKCFGEMNTFLKAAADVQAAQEIVKLTRRPLDHKKFLDMLIDDMEDKYIELLEGTRAHIATIDDYIKRLATALEDDFNTQFYHPAFRQVRKASSSWDVTLGQVETTSILANNRAFAKVSPQATMEFDLPKREIVLQEAMKGAKAAIDDYGALVSDPSFLALVKMGAGQSPADQVKANGGFSTMRSVLPGLPSDTAEQILSQQGPGGRELGAALESLIPDPAIYKFETGTGYEIRPVIQPDGQSVVFHFNYMYTTNVREPVRADEKHLGRVKRHFIDTDVQTGNYELREVSRYQVALKAARTGQGVPLLQDIPGVGVLFRPLPSAESSLQQNVILAQSVIYPTLYDLMGLRWAPVVADRDTIRMKSEEFIVRQRTRQINNRVFDYSSGSVDEFLRIPEAERRGDLYRSQETIPRVHPNGYQGPGLNYQDSHLREGYDPRSNYPETRFVPTPNAEETLPGPRLIPQRIEPAPPMFPPDHLRPGETILTPPPSYSQPQQGTEGRQYLPLKEEITPQSFQAPVQAPSNQAQRAYYQAPYPTSSMPAPVVQAGGAGVPSGTRVPQIPESRSSFYNPVYVPSGR